MQRKIKLQTRSVGSLFTIETAFKGMSYKEDVYHQEYRYFSSIFPRMCPLILSLCIKQ